MKIIITSDCEKALNVFPKSIRRLYTIQERRFITNWRDPRLHLKKVKELEEAFSIRITRRYRAFFYFQNADTAVFFDIDHSKDIYR